MPLGCILDPVVVVVLASKIHGRSIVQLTIINVLSELECPLAPTTDAPKRGTIVAYDMDAMHAWLVADLFHARVRLVLEHGVQVTLTS